MSGRDAIRLPALWLAVAALTSATLSAQSATSSIDAFLRASIGLDAGQLADVQRGKAVTKILKTDSVRDVAVFGIVAVHTTRDAYAASLGDVRRLIAPRTQRFGIIGDPVTAADVEGATVDASEYKDLRKCKVSDCNFKLPASTMRDLAQNVDWNGSGAKAQVDSILRADLRLLISSYRSSGNAAMVRYDDGRGVESSDAFAALLAQSPSLNDDAPPLRDYLLSYPAHAPDGARDLMYWSEERIPHLRPTFTVTHMIVYTSPAGVPFVARKQIYADHYFEAAFDMLAAVDAPSLPGGPGIYLVSIRRYRFDNLPSGGFLNIRGRVRDQLANLLRADLERERASAEHSTGKENQP